MLYMQSTSTNDGNYSLIVTFKIGTDPDFAQVLVQNRVAAAMAQLPRVRAGPGRGHKEEIDRDPADHRAHFAAPKI